MQLADATWLWTSTPPGMITLGGPASPAAPLTQSSMSQPLMTQPLMSAAEIQAAGVPPPAAPAPAPIAMELRPMAAPAPQPAEISPFPLPGFAASALVPPPASGLQATSTAAVMEVMHALSVGSGTGAKVAEWFEGTGTPVRSGEEERSTYRREES